MCKASICSLLADVECLWLDVLIIFYCSKDSIYLYEYIRKNRQKSKITRYTNASLCDVENCSVQCEITEFTFELNVRSIRITLIASNYQCVYSLLRNCVWLFGLRNDSNGTHNSWMQIIAKLFNFKQRRLSIYVNVHASSLKMFELPNRNSSGAITNRSFARSLARAHHTHLHTECITASSMCTCKTCSLIADLLCFLSYSHRFFCYEGSNDIVLVDCCVQKCVGVGLTMILMHFGKYISAFCSLRVIWFHFIPFSRNCCCSFYRSFFIKKPLKMKWNICPRKMNVII